MQEMFNKGLEALENKKHINNTTELKNKLKVLNRRIIDSRIDKRQEDRIMETTASSHLSNLCCIQPVQSIRRQGRKGREETEAYKLHVDQPW